ncbi:hypothetical protein ACWD6R_04035 [Streptomyces sp. NPDC005151]
MLIFRAADTVHCQSRSGRIVTAAFPDLAVAATDLAPWSVLDGEAAIVVDGTTDFGAVVPCGKRCRPSPRARPQAPRLVCRVGRPGAMTDSAVTRRHTWSVLSLGA